MKKRKKRFRLAMLVSFLVLTGSVTVLAASGNSYLESVSRDGTWTEKKQGKRFQYKNKTYAKKIWLTSGGAVYYLNEKGYCETGWFEVNEKKFYADKKGRILAGKWLYTSKNRYYFKKDASMACGGWMKIKGKEYYFQKSGKLARGCWIGSYYVNQNGMKMKSVLMKKSGKWYYLGADGKCVKKQWMKRGEKEYYFTKDGSMAISCWVGSYYVGSDGVKKKNCIVDGYYLNQNGKKTDKINSYDVIFLGDSRTVGMENAVKEEKVRFLGKVGMGYEWLKTTAGPQLMWYLDRNPKVKVVLAFGVNDMGNVERYLDYYEKLFQNYPDTEFYIMSVNPVVESKWKSVKNSQIEAFNKKIYLKFRTKYINVYSYMKAKGFKTVDGLHYMPTTYQAIYEYVRKKIG